VMLILGKIRPKKDEYTPKQTEIIDTTPWKHAITVSILIAILVLTTYFIF
jgi:SSS family solute:Na+ symporter